MKKSFFKELNSEELVIFYRLSTPKKIQDFLEKLPINFEKKGDTCMSPRRILREKKAHCMEGALFAATALWFHGQKPLLLDLKSVDHDFDHVVALFKNPPAGGGKWGAISKTNHAVLRYREPVYRDVRELAMSFFHEYFTDDGKKTMRSFSRPFNLQKFGYNWITSEKDLWEIADALDASKHYPILTKKTLAGLRKADLVEIKAGKITQWKK
ncbi:MAG: hypothetical protein HYT63_00510 [Candidatus Yanofskybacteria bacterium]|nr:hypothetical protein [Candidatus Yanofskybacteria bacterium]